ncbi:condensin subunit YCG1 [Aspergillus clavatus NRRL 1]|uniref:Nuclear condensin complex subunit 3, putative n=1 Tax=Aspergillus clavatus (strain ATCC 1007 / CBS 513.65 / DSM 816 / NCTC 3887 / NRRL 1 / QM 1276 / 107) TaxID=344612 RepID=A1C5C8_ASPCL|nr:nuclear condensin complex subunit 3, putative [Aspergillus clavatus NRRL 1]EAW14896.1 nuclear condensin complex subunit 3, putative [Aspergillus clavatus NRRL 1]
MPSRVSARSTSAATRKSSAQPSASGGRAASVTPSFVIPPEPALPEASPNLRHDVCLIFADAQRSTTGHRKLVVRLRKIQEICCGISQKKTKKDAKDSQASPELVLPSEETIPEKEFNVEIGRCLLRIVPIKKTEPVGDRILRFVGTFLAHSFEKDTEIFGSDDDEDMQSIVETPTARLAIHLVSIVAPLLSAKDKTVRFRATQITTHIVNCLDTIDDDLYHTIRQGLLKRIRDKEPSVRVQAVMGLGRLAGNEEEDGDDKDDSTTALLEKLIDIMQNDTSAEVRKTLLLNLPLAPATLPYLLERARDLEATTRRALYSRLLPTLGDFRHLSLTMREKLLRWGLRDRDENVRKATGKLFYDRWVEDCAGTNNDPENGPSNQRSSPNISALLELLERIDVVSSGMDSGIAHEAMRSFWEGRPDYREAVVFDEPFWESLTAESAFLLRSFNDFCRVETDGKYDSLADEKMPEVTAFAHFLQKYITDLLRRKKLNKESSEANDDETVEIEFIVEQLLHIAITLDYSDEVGRRKMFSLLRESLAVPELPEECTKLTVETLRCVCGPAAAAENEFCSVVLEAVAEVHDTIVTEDSFVSARSEVSDATSSRHRSETPSEASVPFNKEEAKAKVLREIMVNMKCLHIAQCMLQNVEGNLQQNMNLVTMLNNLVVPAVRSHEAPIREKGLECLGLCCLLDKTLAEENMTLFIHCYSKGHEALQVTALHILCDMVTTHPALLAPVTQPDGETISPPAFQKPLLKVFARALRASSPNTVQTAAATGLSKLLLTNTFSPSGSNIPQAIQEYNESAVETLLQSLIVSFFHPRTRENPAFRQSLAYFFPVYCHSRLENTQHMRRVAVPVVRAVLNAAEEYYSLEAEEDSDGEIDESVGEKELKALMAGVVGMLAEWTDERRVVGLGGEKVLAGGPASSSACGFVHLALVKDILERVLGVSSGTNRCSKDEKKLLFSLLSKLYVAPPALPSRSGSRAPESDDAFRSSIRSGNGGEIVSPENAALALEVKELLDETIQEGLAAEAAGRNALVKVKNSILKLIAAAQGVRSDSVRPREGTEDIDSDAMSIRSGSVRPSIEHPSSRRRAFSLEPSIMEEDENDDSRGTIIKSEMHDE